MRIFIEVIFYKSKNHTYFNLRHFIKTFLGEKPLGIWVDKIAGFIKIDNGIRYLVLDHSRFNKFLRSEKSGIVDSIIHDLART